MVRNSRSAERYNLLARQRALSRLRSSSRRGSRSARLRLAAIRQRAWRNLRALRAALVRNAVLRRAIRRRFPQRYRGVRRSRYDGYIGVNPRGTGQRRRLR